MVNADEVREIIWDAIERHVVHWSGATRWRTPLLAFASADDPGFAELGRRSEGHHSLPRELLRDARSVATYFLPFDEGIVAANAEHRSDVAREWAVAYVETNAIISTIGETAVEGLQRAGVDAVALAATGEFDRSSLTSAWSHKSAAVLAGLGTIGVNNMLITRSGCAGRIGSLVLSAEAEPGARPVAEMCGHKSGGDCLECVERCPVGALRQDGSIDRQLCWSRCRVVSGVFSSVGLAQVCGKCAVGPCATTGGVPESAGA